MRHDAKGEVRFIRGTWTARVRAFGRREPFELPTCTTRDGALERAALLSTLARRFKLAKTNQHQATEAMRIVATASPKSLRDAVRAGELLLGGEIPIPGQPAGPTFEEHCDELTSGRLHTKHPDHVKARSFTLDKVRLKKLCDLDADGIRLGDIRLERFTLGHAETAMRSLEAMNEKRKVKRPATRRAYAQILSRVLSLAVYPCRHITVSPLPKGFLPKAGKAPAHSYLYPAEDALLMRHEGTPLGYRVLFGVLAREGLRIGEALRLRWRDVDLDRGVLSLDKNKTDDPRAWVLGEDVSRALRAWKSAHRNPKPDDAVFGGAEFSVDRGDLADFLRASLSAAGIGRPELFERTANRGWLRVHDLRGTFVTLALAIGKTETWVADRTGHQSSQMINRYRRASRHAGELALGWLEPLDLFVPELSPIPGIQAGLAKVSGHRYCPSIAPNALSLGSDAAPKRRRLQGGPTETRTRDLRIKKAARTKPAKRERRATAQKKPDPENERPPSSPLVSPPGQCWGNSEPPDPPGEPSRDAVEAALADALTKASAAGEWTAVEVLSRELKARREARANVVTLDTERKRRER